MTFGDEFDLITQSIAVDYTKSWSIGFWFVITCAVVGYALQSMFGVSFYPALAVACAVAATVTVNRAVRSIRPPLHDTRERTDKLVPNVVAPSNAPFREGQELGRALAVMHIYEFTSEEVTGFFFFKRRRHHRSLAVVVYGNAVISLTGDAAKIDEFHIPQQLRAAIDQAARSGQILLPQRSSSSAT